MSLVTRIRSWFRRTDAMPAQGALVVRQDQYGNAGGITNLLTGSGLPSLDSGAAAMPTPGYRLSYWDCDVLYEENGYAQRIVDELPKDATRRGWEVTCDGEPAREVIARDEELGLRQALCQAGKTSRQYGAAWILLIFDEEPNAQNSAGQKLIERRLAPRAVKGIKCLHVLDPTEVTPMTWDGDIESPRFRKPLTYLVQPTSSGTSAVPDYQVHHSRLLYMGGVELCARRRSYNNDHDLTVLQAAWPSIAQVTQADQSISGFLNKLSIFVIKIAGLAAKAAGVQREITQLRMEDANLSMRSTGALFLDEGDEASVLASASAGIGDLHDRSKEAMSATSGMPLTRLFGEAPGGLSTDGASQAAAWREQIGAFQQDKLMPVLERYYSYLLPTLYSTMPEDWKITFNPLDEPTDAELAEADKARADLDAIYLQNGVLRPEEARRLRKETLGLADDEVELDLEPTEDDERAANKIIAA